MPVSGASPDARAGEVLRRLGRNRPSDCRDLLVVFAHPDDETIALGGRFARLSGVRLLHVTDGAPIDMVDARRHGFTRREDYAAARARELAAALALAGLPVGSRASFAVPDQEAARQMPALARRLAASLAAEPARCILTHAYEGGHPDHDATSLIVRAACHLLTRDGRTPPTILEAPLYHARDGRMVTQDFAPEPAAPAMTLELTRAERAAKARLFGAFVTQREVLAAFTAPVERFRPAPLYDTVALPNGGAVLYDQFSWGLRGSDWLALAAEMRASLDLPRWL